MQRILTVAILAITTLPALAGDELPRVGHAVNAFKADSALTPVNGTLLEIKTEKTNPLNEKFVYVRIKPDGQDPIDGWYELGAKKAKKTCKKSGSDDCCCGHGGNTIVINNAAEARLPALDHYSGPVRFTNNIVNNVDVNVDVQQAAPQRESTYCTYCGLPTYGIAGRGVYCPTYRTWRPWGYRYSWRY